MSGLKRSSSQGDRVRSRARQAVYRVVTATTDVINVNQTAIDGRRCRGIYDRRWTEEISLIARLIDRPGAAFFRGFLAAPATPE